jgi:hypothetical protein
MEVSNGGIRFFFSWDFPFKTIRKLGYPHDISRWLAVARPIQGAHQPRGWKGTSTHGVLQGMKPHKWDHGMGMLKLGFSWDHFPYENHVITWGLSAYCLRYMHMISWCIIWFSISTGIDRMYDKWPQGDQNSKSKPWGLLNPRLFKKQFVESKKHNIVLVFDAFGVCLKKIYIHIIYIHMMSIRCPPCLPREFEETSWSPRPDLALWSGRCVRKVQICQVVKGNNHGGDMQIVIHQVGVMLELCIISYVVLYNRF